MKDNDDLELEITLPIVSSVFDDIEHRILSPLSCLKEFDSHWLLECDLPLVDKKDIKITCDDRTVSIDAKLREKYSEEKLGNITKFEYFKKSVLLPGKIDSKKILARFQKGRLEIKIPKNTIGRSIKIS